MLNFWQSIETVDIWTDTNTVDGKIKYLFWFMGKTYERDTEDEIRALARQLYNDWYQKANAKKR